MRRVTAAAAIPGGPASVGFSLDFVDVSFGPRAIGRLGLLAPKIYRRVRAVLRALPLPVPR